MRFRNSSDGYGGVSLFLHWITVALVLIAWTTGTFDDLLPKGSGRASAMFVHNSAGLTILLALALRLLWRLVDPPPPAEPTMLGKWLDRAGMLAHYALYAMLLAALTAGIALQFARGNALNVFGLFEIPSPWLADRTLSRPIKGAHELFANGLIVLVGIHAAAALVHHRLLRDRTLLRMLPESWR